MIPLTTEYFSSMFLQNLNRHVIGDIEQLETAVTSCAQYLIGVPLIETHIVGAIRGLPFSEHSNVCVINLKKLFVNQENGYLK